MLYVIMEYVHGSSLFKAASGKKIDPAQAIEIILKACRGLAHAHGHGIIHRDIKPTNILLTRECEPKICDFGMARPDGVLLGTHGYIAPEVLGQSEEGDHRADIFAIGIILKEMLTGVSAAAEEFQHTSCDDPHLSAICEKATEPDPAQRFSNIGELCHALESWRQRRPNRLHVPANRPATAVRKTSVPFRRPSLAQVHSSRANWKPLRNCALVALLLAACHLAWNSHRDKQEFIVAQARKKAIEQSANSQSVAAEPAADVWASAVNDY
jgi:serine/threonine protein kinase